LDQFALGRRDVFLVQVGVGCGQELWPRAGWTAGGIRRHGSEIDIEIRVMIDGFRSRQKRRDSWQTSVNGRETKKSFWMRNLLGKL